MYIKMKTFSIALLLAATTLGRSVSFSSDGMKGTMALVTDVDENAPIDTRMPSFTSEKTKGTPGVKAREDTAGLSFGSSDKKGVFAKADAPMEDGRVFSFGSADNKGVVPLPEEEEEAPAMTEWASA